MDLVQLLISCTPQSFHTTRHHQYLSLCGLARNRRYHGPMDLWLLKPFKTFELLKNCIECETKMMIQPYLIWILPQHHQIVMVSFEVIDLSVDIAHFWQAAVVFSSKSRLDSDLASCGGPVPK